MLDGVGKTVRVAGMAGPQGESAYQAWRAAGNGGDEAAFLASLQGQDGRDGVDGAGTVVMRTAAVGLQANVNVVDNGDGSVSPADPSNVAHCGKLVGLVQTPVLAGGLASIALLGPLTGVTGAFTAGQRLWIGPGGICTGTPPASGWRQTIGTAGPNGNIVYEKGIAGLYDPSSPLVLLPPGSPAAAMVILDAIFSALPFVPADPSGIPTGGGYFREGDASGWRLVKLFPPA